MVRTTTRIEARFLTLIWFVKTKQNKGWGPMLEPWLSLYQALNSIPSTVISKGNAIMKQISKHTKWYLCF